MAIATYKKIASVTVGSGGQAEIEFANIPSNYSDLILKISARSNRTSSPGYDGLYIYINNTTTGYSGRYVQGYNAAASSNSNSSAYTDYVNANDSTASTFSNVEILFPNYAGNANKSYSQDSAVEGNATNGYPVTLTASLWSNTSIINSIKLDPVSGTLFVQYSTATLYGIVRSN